MTDLLRSTAVVGASFLATFVLLVEGMPVLVGIPGLVVIAVLAAWWWFLSKPSRGRPRSPFQMAFTTTVAAALFVGAGTIGYTLSGPDRFRDGTPWTDGVIWWEVGVGLALLPFAAYFWRKSFRSLGSSAQAELST